MFLIRHFWPLDHVRMQIVCGWYAMFTRRWLIALRANIDAGRVPVDSSTSRQMLEGNRPPR